MVQGGDRNEASEIPANCEAGLQRCPALPLWTSVHFLATPLMFPMVYPIQPASRYTLTLTTPDEMEDLR